MDGGRCKIMYVSGQKQTSKQKYALVILALCAVLIGIVAGLQRTPPHNWTQRILPGTTGGIQSPSRNEINLAATASDSHLPGYANGSGNFGLPACVSESGQLGPEVPAFADSGEVSSSSLPEVLIMIPGIQNSATSSAEDHPISLQVAAASRSSTFSWPLTGKVTDGYGWRTHPITGKRQFHEGIDIAAPSGTAVKASASGTVTFAGWSNGYGRLIVISHGEGYETKYGHLSRYAVSKGSRVSTGDTLGYVGQSGEATGPHLHFEIRVSGQAKNPRNYLP